MALRTHPHPFACRLSDMVQANCNRRREELQPLIAGMRIPTGEEIRQLAQSFGLHPEQEPWDDATDRFMDLGISYIEILEKEKASALAFGEPWPRKPGSAEGEAPQELLGTLLRELRKSRFATVNGNIVAEELPRNGTRRLTVEALSRKAGVGQDVIRAFEHNRPHSRASEENLALLLNELKPEAADRKKIMAAYRVYAGPEQEEPSGWGNYRTFPASVFSDRQRK